MTVLIASGTAVAIVAAVFGTTTLQRHDDQANRLVAAALLAEFVGLLASPALHEIGVPMSGTDPSSSQLMSLLVSNGGAAIAALLMWNGFQCFGGRTPMIAFSVGSIFLCLGASAAVAYFAPEWQLLPAAVVVALGAGFGTVELQHSPMRSNLNSRVLRIALWLVAVGAIGAAAVGGTQVVQNGDSWAIFSGVQAALALATGLTLMAMRVERYGNWWALGDAQDRAELGVHERVAFVEEAIDRLDRCRNAGQEVHVIVTSLPGLNELNRAYGHLAGDAAMRWVAELLRRQAPSSAVLGHLGAGRFAVVTSRDPELVASSIQNGMMRVAPPQTLPVRLTPVFAWASTDEATYDFDRLRAMAEERLSYVG